VKLRQPIHKACNVRGAALVELAVLMLIFVPLILVPLYFQDALRFKFSLQEAVYSTVWDFAYADFVTQSFDQASADIVTGNRNIYANLRSGDSLPKRTPAGPWADFNWTSEIQCIADRNFGAEIFDGSVPLAREFHENPEVGTKGGLVTCSGAISVANHFLPTFFLPRFSARRLIDRPLSGNAGTPSTDPATADAIYYKAVRSGLLVDPWTVHDPADAEGDGSGNPSYAKRVKTVWTQGAAARTFEQFKDNWGILKIAAYEFLNPLADMDDPTVLRLSSLHTTDRTRQFSVSGGRQEFYVTPYDDGMANAYQLTFEARSSYYLGCSFFGPNCE